MSEYTELLHKMAVEPHQINDADIAALRRACREHPADAIAPALLLKYAPSQLDEAELAYARARVSLYCGRPSTLVVAIDPSGKGFDKFYPPTPLANRPSTANAIDIFLQNYGHTSAEEDAMLERMIFNPVPDYAEQLARESEKANPAPQSAHGSQDERIAAFLDTHPASTTEKKAEIVPPPIEGGSQPEKKPKKAQPAPTSMLSQSLAKIFIKQGRYERAFEIISNLNLNYPEKSVYFADQLRFLQKLIDNQRLAENATNNNQKL